MKPETNCKNMEQIDFDDFLENCYDELLEKQDRFTEQYNISSYQSWFYDQVTGIFTFENPGDKIYFRFEIVGTLSDKSGTWKWSWDNEYIDPMVRASMAKIKAFGERNQFEKLREGLWKAEEIDGWEMTAIAAYLLNAIGTYRVPSNGFIFMLFIEKLTEKEVSQIKERYVFCDAHETARRAFVCQHLNTKTVTGFHEAFETFPGMELDEEEDFQAWCDQCNLAFEKEGEWTDEAMELVNLKVICEHCYFEMKERNGC